jgi:hypothetical protein
VRYRGRTHRVARPSGIALYARQPTPNCLPNPQHFPLVASGTFRASPAGRTTRQV